MYVVTFPLLRRAEDFSGRIYPQFTSCYADRKFPSLKLQNSRPCLLKCLYSRREGIPGARAIQYGRLFIAISFSRPPCAGEPIECILITLTFEDESNNTPKVFLDIGVFLGQRAEKAAKHFTTSVKRLPKSSFALFPPRAMSQFLHSWARHLMIVRTIREGEAMLSWAARKNLLLSLDMHHHNLRALLVG